MKLANSLFLAPICVLLMSSCAGMQHEEAHDWQEMPHHLSLLVASTIEEDESAPSLGVDYEFRRSEFLGLGVVLERALEEIDATTVLGVADLHITNQFIVQTGPGIEFVGGEEELVYRTGVLYEFEFGGYTVSPQLHYDWTSGEDAVIIGLAFGIGF
ncbi:MAG: hypothetical protein ACI8X5_003233 [Planctomycetota bacterium]|jgi:hypothetical protein